MGAYKPDWLERPTADDMEWAYPAHAQRKEIDGKAVITCKVGYDGLLRDCRVLSETPKGEDFGIAAIALSQKFRMLPPDSPPSKLEDVTIPVIFQVPRAARPMEKRADPYAPVTFQIGDLFRIGIVNEGTPQHPAQAPRHTEAPTTLILGAAALALVVLIAMVFGLGRRSGRHRKP